MSRRYDDDWAHDVNALEQASRPDPRLMYINQPRHADTFDWVRPTSSPIGFPRIHGVGDTGRFCTSLAASAGVLLLPGSVCDHPGDVRIGFGRANLPTALAGLESNLDGEMSGAKTTP